VDDKTLKYMGDKVSRCNEIKVTISDLEKVIKLIELNPSGVVDVTLDNYSNTEYNRFSNTSYNLLNVIHGRSNKVNNSIKNDTKLQIAITDAIVNYANNQIKTLNEEYDSI